MTRQGLSWPCAGPFDSQTAAGKWGRIITTVPGAEGNRQARASGYKENHKKGAEETPAAQKEAL